MLNKSIKEKRIRRKSRSKRSESFRRRALAKACERNQTAEPIKPSVLRQSSEPLPSGTGPIYHKGVPMSSPMMNQFKDLTMDSGLSSSSEEIGYPTDTLMGYRSSIELDDILEEPQGNEDIVYTRQHPKQYYQRKSPHCNHFQKSTKGVEKSRSFPNFHYDKHHTDHRRKGPFNFIETYSNDAKKSSHSSNDVEIRLLRNEGRLGNPYHSDIETRSIKIGAFSRLDNRRLFDPYDSRMGNAAFSDNEGRNFRYDCKFGSPPSRDFRKVYEPQTSKRKTGAVQNVKFYQE